MKFEYVNVVMHPDRIAEMLTYSKGRRSVPVIVEGGKTTVGYGGS